MYRYEYNKKGKKNFTIKLTEPPSLLPRHLPFLFHRELIPSCYWVLMKHILLLCAFTIHHIRRLLYWSSQQSAVIYIWDSNLTLAHSAFVSLSFCVNWKFSQRTERKGNKSSNSNLDVFVHFVKKSHFCWLTRFFTTQKNTTMQHFFTIKRNPNQVLARHDKLASKALHRRRTTF